jgi:transcriptional regulator with XRE-family HTH domain
MHRTEISVLERGRREPRLQTLIKLSAALEAPLAQFFTGIEWRPLVLSPRVEAMGCFHIIQPEQVNERL